MHLLTCDVRKTRKEAHVKLWKEIYQRIRAQQKQGSPDPRLLLRPFLLRDEKLTPTPTLPPAPGAGAGNRHQPDPLRYLRQVAAFPDDAAALGLIPKDLVGALKELGVKCEMAGQLADEVSQLAQSTLAREVRAHTRALALHRAWPALYRQHVLGLRPTSHPPP